MPNYFDIHTANGSMRVRKDDLSYNNPVDMDLVHKTDEGKIPIRINNNTIILKRK